MKENEKEQQVAVPGKDQQPDSKTTEVNSQREGIPSQDSSISGEEKPGKDLEEHPGTPHRHDYKTPEAKQFPGAENQDKGPTETPVSDPNMNQNSIQGAE